MSGLEKITNQIMEDAARECSQTLEKANAECERIRLEYKQKAGELVKEIEALGAAEIVKIEEAAKSKAMADSRKQLLEAEQGMVSAVSGEALESLQNRHDDRYFENLSKLLIKYAHDESGEILLSKNDIAAIPPHFQLELDKRNLKINENESITGGFVLRYGKIEENCTFEALFSEKKETIRDKVHEILFAQRR